MADAGLRPTCLATMTAAPPTSVPATSAARKPSTPLIAKKTKMPPCGALSSTPVPMTIAPVSAPPSKPCAVCGRTITWRKKWERDWDAVRVCSDACRRAGVSPTDRALQEAVLTLLDARAAGTVAGLQLAPGDRVALKQPLVAVLAEEVPA